MIGKGVCFDAGGLDIKSSEGMLTMFLDKQGATSVLAAF
jgi:leucyl aminopeptidase